MAGWIGSYTFIKKIPIRPPCAQMAATCCHFGSRGFCSQSTLSTFIPPRTSHQVRRACHGDQRGAAAAAAAAYRHHLCPPFVSSNEGCSSWWWCRSNMAGLGLSDYGAARPGPRGGQHARPRDSLDESVRGLCCCNRGRSRRQPL